MLPALLTACDIRRHWRCAVRSPPRFAHHGDHVIGHLAYRYGSRPCCEPSAHRVAAPFERLDEHRNRGQAVGIHHLAAERARIAQAPLQLDHLLEAGQLGGKAPAGELRRRGARRPRRANRAAKRAFTMSRVTRPMVSSVKVNCSTGSPAASTVTARSSMPLRVGVKAVAVAQIVARPKDDRLAFVARDARFSPSVMS